MATHAPTPRWRRIGVGLLLIAIPALAGGPGALQLEEIGDTQRLLVDAGARRA